MMMQFEIKNRYTGAVLYAGGGEALRDVVEAAVRDGARLDGASLDGASLDGARLDGAWLDGARLDGAWLDGASLVGASLDGARLDGAWLDGASLVGAWLDGARLYNNRLVGRRPIIQIGPIGSRSGYLVAYLTDAAGVMIRAGCFFGTLDAFRAACAETHGDSIHGREYAAAIAMIESHAALWTPAA